MSNFTLFKRPISHIHFVLLYAVLLYTVSNAINFDKIVKWFYLGDEVHYSALLAYLLLGLCLFILFLLLLAHPRILKTFTILLLIPSAAATYFIDKYGIAVDRSMVMNTLHTDTTEVTGLLSVQMLPYLLFLVVLPAWLILKTRIHFQRPPRYLLSSLMAFLLVLTVGTAALYSKFDSISQAVNLSRKYVVHSLVPVNVIRSSISAASRALQPVLASYREPIPIDARISRADDLVVVLAIGETSRQKSFSLYGYARNTNPKLSNIDGLHVLNGKARIGTTLYALREILEKNDIKLPAVSQAAGIDTACYVNYSLYDNCDAVGEIEVSNCAHDGVCYDEDTIPLLQSNLNSYQGGYRLIVLHLGGGSHGPSYSDRYPPEFQHFQPMCEDADVVNQCTLEQLYNSYDNTILYVDHVVAGIIDALEQSRVPYVMIYLSDHGESLLEDGRIFHGMPPGIPLPPEQSDIPLLIKSSEPLHIVQRDEYGQQDVFDTVLDLLSIESPQFDKRQSFIKTP